MKLVLENNRKLKVAREALQLAVLEAGTGNTPPDPEVEFGYLFGHPTDLGNRVDIEITQQLDFPTVYAHRSKLKQHKSDRAELQYILTRQQVLLEARQLWIEQVYLNQLGTLLGERLRQARTIQSHMEKKLEAGEASMLDLGQSQLMVASLEAEHGELLARAEDLRLGIREITGGTDLEIRDTIYPLSSTIVADSLLNAYRLGSYVQYFDQQLLVKEAELDVIKSLHLPRLAAGYYSESVTDADFRGFRVGVSLPLWEHANTIKTARSEVAVAEAEIDRFVFQQEQEVRQKLNRLESYRSRARNLEKALGMVNSQALLATALENGEISMSEYFYTSDIFFRNQAQLLRYKKELRLQEAELMRIYL
jgi:cobalt-zinc-cadmium efflux system outer membrane protein